MKEECPNISTDNKVYGKYSMGGGSILKNPDKLFRDIDDHEIIESYRTSMKRDIKRMGISLNEFKNYDVLDVGSGRQAIAFYLLGAKYIYHYDISPYQVGRMKQFIESNSVKDRITSVCADLTKIKLPRYRFDLVYLHGIVQHFRHTGIGLRNCMNAVRKGGYLWLYFYRSGTYIQFIIYLLRDLIKLSTIDDREVFINATILFSDVIKPNFFVSTLMDNLFVTYSHLYTPKSYISFIHESGFQIVFSSKLDPFGKDIDHENAHLSTILCIKRVAEKDLFKCNVDILSPEMSINQLDNTIYSSDIHSEIIKSIHEYESLKEILRKKNIPNTYIMSLVFKILRFAKDIDVSESENKHELLQELLINCREIIEEEYNFK